MLTYWLVADNGNLCQRLEGINLDLLLVDTECAEETTHDEVTLVFILEILSCDRNRTLQSFDCDFSKFKWLSLDIAEGGVEDFTDLLWLQSLV